MSGVLLRLRAPELLGEKAPVAKEGTARVLCTFWIGPEGRIRRVTGEDGRELCFGDALALIAHGSSDDSIGVRPYHDDNGSWALSQHAKRQRGARTSAVR